jgi:hypothetical protein
MTADEKSKFTERLLDRERKAHPGAIVNVHVDDYIDENGRVRYTTTIQREIPVNG